MSGFEMLVSGKDLNSVKKRRMSAYEYCSIKPQLQSEYEKSGWEVSKINKTSIRMQKLKPFDEQFEDEVWLVMYKIGFQIMNADRNFKLKYNPNNKNISKQIDVFAVDEETVLVIECKSSINGPKKTSFKGQIEAIEGYKRSATTEIRKAFPGRKIKYIFATKNYTISKADKELLVAFGIELFNESMIKYYSKLAEHLGSSARYQLLGQLFPKQQISNLDCKIPAIEGRMGGYKYYEFSIEPEKLLKIGYVLHRITANSSLMPTYQRIIKKPRLIAVRNFVERGGFFPNSIIISIETQGRSLQFDLSSLQVETALSKIGVLHLPQVYRSAYIIDGQHRLYGYADTPYEKTNCIPVVAFVDLDQETQIKLFMEINENQKAVQKNLRQVLESGLLRDSESQAERRKAIRLLIAQYLGTASESPLYNRVIIDENEKTPICIITIDTIQGALAASHFLSKFNSNNAIIYDGTFDKGENEATFDFLSAFIIECLNYIQEEKPEEWETEDEKSNIILTNNGIWATIKIINDIVNHIAKTMNCNIKSEKPRTIFEMTRRYLDVLLSYLSDLSAEKVLELRRSYGSGGKAYIWREFENVIHNRYSDFQPEGLVDYLEKKEMKYNEDSYKMIRNIELSLKNRICKIMEEEYGEEWIIQGVPKEVYDDVKRLQADKEFELRSAGDKSNISLYDCFTLIHYRKIVLYRANWSNCFETIFTMPDEKKKSGGKDGKTEWMQKLNTIRNHNFHTYSVTEDEFKYIQRIHTWLI